MQLLMELCRYGTLSTARIASRKSAKILDETSLHVWHVYGHNVPWVSWLSSVKTPVVTGGTI